MPKGFTIFLGIAEVAGALGVAFGVLTQLAAFGLIVLMLGAIKKKIFSWHTGFWGGKTYGWHYELMFILMNLVIAFTDGGQYVLLKFKEIAMSARFEIACPSFPHIERALGWPRMDPQSTAFLAQPRRP